MWKHSGKTFVRTIPFPKQLTVTVKVFIRGTKKVMAKSEWIERATLDYACKGLSEYDANDDKDIDENVSTIELHENVLVNVKLDNSFLQKNLVKLSLHNNRLTRVPACVCRLVHLIWLSLHYNTISFLPEEFGNLKNLQRLSLHNNVLTVLPKSFKDLTKIKVISLFRNDLSDLDDDVFSHFSQCKKIALHQNNRLCRLPTSINQMTSLEDLWIGDTGIAEESVPRHIARVWT